MLILKIILFMVKKVTPSQKSINRITTKTFRSATADSEWCGVPVNAMTVKNVKNVNIQLKLLPISREYVNIVPRFGCKKNSLLFPLHSQCLLRPQIKSLANLRPL